MRLSSLFHKCAAFAFPHRFLPVRLCCRRASFRVLRMVHLCMFPVGLRLCSLRRSARDSPSVFASLFLAFAPSSVLTYPPCPLHIRWARLALALRSDTVPLPSFRLSAFSPSLVMALPPAVVSSYVCSPCPCVCLDFPRSPLLLSFGSPGVPLSRLYSL